MIQLANAVHHDYGYQLAQTFFSEPKEKTGFFNQAPINCSELENLC